VFFVLTLQFFVSYFAFILSFQFFNYEQFNSLIPKNGPPTSTMVCCGEICFSTFIVYFSYRYIKNKPYPKSRFCRGVPGQLLHFCSVVYLFSMFQMQRSAFSIWVARRLALTSFHCAYIWFPTSESICRRRYVVRLCCFIINVLGVGGSTYLREQVFGENSWQGRVPHSHSYSSVPRCSH
jgi:hypothetical protein